MTSRNESIEREARRSRSATRMAVMTVVFVTVGWLGSGLAAAEDAPAAKPKPAAAAPNAVPPKYGQLLAGIDLSDEQKASIDAIDAEQAENMQNRKEQAAALRQKHRAAKQAGNDEEAEAIRAEFQKLAAGATHRIDRIREVLTDDQKAKLDANLEAMKAVREKKRAARAAKRKPAK